MCARRGNKTGCRGFYFLLSEYFLQRGQRGSQGLGGHSAKQIDQAHLVNRPKPIQHDQALGSGMGDRHTERRGKIL
jgi:hypothetical protein